MTVTPRNLDNVWAAAEFGLRFPHVRGVSYQPFFTSGRRDAVDAAAYTPLTTADVLLSLIANSGKLGRTTSHHCRVAIRTARRLLSAARGRRSALGERVRGFPRAAGFLRDKVRYSLDDLVQCGCENEPLGELLRGSNSMSRTVPVPAVS